MKDLRQQLELQTTMRILLISNSYLYGCAYLDHCADEIQNFLGKRRDVLFVPYAAQDHDGYTRMVRSRFLRIGHDIHSIHKETSPHTAAKEAEAVFVGGGNTFLLLKTLQERGLIEVLHSKILEGTPYIGASAGANVACPNIKTTNDMPIVQPLNFAAFNLVPFNINPHYPAPDPNSTHMGETREMRLAEFHQFNDLPVLALREGAILRIEDREVNLKGSAGAVLFLKGQKPKEYRPIERMDFLLETV